MTITIENQEKNADSINQKVSNYLKLRNKFIEFFTKKKHQLVPPSKLIQNDTSLFFTNAGMNQFKNYFTLEERAPFSRAVTIQPCIRAGGKHNDLDNVGFTARHHTFFEMMGNFSFYDYFKEEAIEYALEFLIKELKINEKKLYFTVHVKDDDAYNIFKKHSKQPVIKVDSDDNFWSMGEVGPCGYCGEIYYYIGDGYGSEEDFRENFNGPNPLYLEIWNLVFMEFNKKIDGSIEQLSRKSVDTGMGLERILSIIEGTYHNYRTSIVMPLVLKAKELFAIEDNVANIAADHSKTALFLLNEGLLIGNEGASYVLRRIIRRALTYLKQPGFWQLLPEVASIYAGVYEFPNLELAINMVKKEEELFFHTIKNGYDKLKQNLDLNQIDESIVFKLYETYGLPLEFSTTVLEEKGIKVDKDKIQSFMNVHRKASGQIMNMEFHEFKTHSTCYENVEDNGKVDLLISNNSVVSIVNTIGEEFIAIMDTSPFYPRGGGQEGDKGIMFSMDNNTKIEVVNTTKKNKAILHHCKLISGVVKNGDILQMRIDENWRRGTSIHHSATHLLHAILQKMFGKQIEQKGSFIANNRFRFDFNFNRNITEEEKEKIENTINDIIAKNITVEVLWMPLATAKAKGAEYLSNMTYEENVRVIRMGEVSFVLCGGIHVKNTGDIPKFTIISEKSVGSGLRRLEVSCV